MDPQRLVWVRTADPQGSGSGYLVGPRLVLTALHVVLDGGRWAGRVEARVGHPRFGETTERQAEVCWPDTRDGIPPDDAPDIALLWLDAPVHAGKGPVRWGRPDGTARIPFTGAGFPAFAADDAPAAQFEDLHGHLSVIGTSLPGWVLDCPVWPAPRRDGQRPWAGASGSAIFCQNRLVGVAVEDNRTMDWRRLHAVPLHEALERPGFAPLIARHGHPGTTTAAEPVTARPATPGADGVSWPVEVGPIPTLASAFQPRSGLRERIDALRSARGTVVLTQVLSGGGGFGKTQLAASCALDALADGVDLVIWASATEAQQVITQYAQAAADLHLPGATGQDPESDARTLLRWLATTDRRWLVVLDDITHPTDLGSWWPAGRTGTGWVLATTRLNDSRLTGGGRNRIDIDVYSPEEADAYLRERLTGDDMAHLLDDRAPALAEALGHLPLALGLAAAHMLNEELTCTAYLRLFTDRRTRLDEALPETADAEGYGRQISAALLLSLEAAQAADRTGVAVPALRMAALLDPAGHPHSLWTTTPLLDHLSVAGDAPATPDRTHAVLRLLHRYALITYDTRAEPRAVRIHALTARAVREAMPESVLGPLAITVGDALLDIWPQVDQVHQELAAVLRANTDVLADHAQHHLWRPQPHPVLHRSGISLLDAGLAESAIAFWTVLADTAHRLLGAEHSDTLIARGHVALALDQAGRTGEAITIEERVAADHARILGAEHRDTLTALHNLAGSYGAMGRISEAIEIQEQVVATRRRLIGADAPDTLMALGNLAANYLRSGRVNEAIEIEEQVAAVRQERLGAEHPDTLAALNNLASSYLRAGRVNEAIEIQEHVVTTCQRHLGADHPQTLTVLSTLASSYWEALRTREAIEIQELVVTRRRRLQGAEHPDTLGALNNLATCYWQADRNNEAAEILEDVFTARLRLLGADHPHTLITRGNLAAVYSDMGRDAEAVAITEEVTEARRRLLGGDHPDTLASRANLAALYGDTGRHADARRLFEEVAADSERVQGPDHPDTRAFRATLAAMPPPPGYSPSR
ncbi:FxSxx-COOH system tetratricopeptide repeat protein [Streptomyces sp. NPDC059491]|uniref:FxSxx-COOH system tetratricopeptide repeat protein n=1 Tax=Streptomyces sp. NPDC059491 TaxID=3346850 RepID=UPI00368A7309